MRQYYLLDGSTKKGPFEKEVLKSEGLRLHTLVWYEGLTDWTPAGELEELKALFLINPGENSFADQAAQINKADRPAPQTAPAANSRAVNTWIPGLIILVTILLLLVIWEAVQHRERKAELVDLKNRLEATMFNMSRQRETVTPAEKENVEDEKRLYYRQHWDEFIQTEAVLCTNVKHGCTNCVNLWVSNFSEYTVDKVIAELYYINTGGDTLDTKEFTMTNLSPTEAKRIQVPYVKATASVEANIILTESKAMKFLYTSWNGESHMVDPYFHE